MTIELRRLVHPYFREVCFTSSEVALFPVLIHCPACGTHEVPEILAHIGSAQTSVQFVQCIDCDHLYYRNPPPPSFFSNFYRDVWNAERGEAKDNRPISISKPKRTAADLASDLGLKGEDKRILEIGCGMGAMLVGLRDAGFTELYGTEASDFRAASALTLFPRTIFPGGYEAVPEGLNFDFIFSHHVMEHVYNPHAAFGWMASRLRSGGVIAITVPDAWHEPVLNQLLFLPHLHSFCHRALMKMGEKYGFSCYFRQGVSIPHEICAVFIRTDNRSSMIDQHFVNAFSADEANPHKQRDRVKRFFDLAVTHRRFALHAGENGSVEMAKVGGIRPISRSQAAMAQVGVPIGQALAASGLRRLGNKWLGRVRFIECQMSDGKNDFSISGSHGRATFHIK